MEAEGRTGGRVALSSAWDSFIADLEAQAVTPGTVKKYKLLRKRLEAYVEQRRIFYASDCTLDLLTNFRATWKQRAFFRFCADRRWTEGNPALSLKAPKVTLCPTLPLTQEE